MQLAGVALGVAAVIVVDAVRDVARFLYLGQQVACADGVDAPCGEEEYVAGSRVVLGQRLGERALGHAPYIFVGCHGRLESGIYLGALVGVDDVPHLGLAKTVVALHGQSIVRVHLYGQVVGGVDYLDEQRELAVISFHHALAEQFGAELSGEVGEPEPLVGTVGHHGLVSGNGRNLPALADAGLLFGYALVATDLVTAPDDALQIGLECYWFQIDHIELDFR